MSKEEKRVKRAKKHGERGEENKIRAYFVRLFGKYDFRNEGQFLYFVKWLTFILLLLVELLILLKGLEGLYLLGGRVRMTWLVCVVTGLTLCMALQLFAVRGIKAKVWFYIADAVAACIFLFFVGGIYSLIVYLVVLTQFYFETKRTTHCVWLLIFSMILYVSAYALQMRLTETSGFSLLQLFSLTFGFIVTVIAHFLATQIALAFYRQYLKLDNALRELDESKKELEKAYAVVAEVAALEERQRIAKEIHDTAGHSITTVIMQTEAAKRIMDTSPEEARVKLTAANLQARHALEEIRDGVHLLSGSTQNRTLKQALLGIIHETTDGTGITVRSEIADLELPPAKHRFLCNTLKECISNGLRHGGATAFWFELKEEAGKLCFLLSDNGKGLAEGSLQLGFGLTTMQERAKALGGEVQFISDIEEGFEVRMTLPV